MVISQTAFTDKGGKTQVHIKTNCGPQQITQSWDDWWEKKIKLLYGGHPLMLTGHLTWQQEKI